MAGGMGMGGFGMGMSMGMPSMAPMSPMMGPMSMGMGSFGMGSMGASTGGSAMAGPMTSLAPTTVNPLPGPMSASYLNVAPAMSQPTLVGGQVPNVPEASLSPFEFGDTPIYNEGQMMQGPNSYGAQDLQYNNQRVYDPYDVMEDVTKGTGGDLNFKPGTMRTPEYSPETLRLMQDTAGMEFGAQSRPNPLSSAKSQVAQSTFEGLGGAGPSADALNATAPGAPDSSFKAGVDPRLASNTTASNVRGMDSALERAGFSPNQRNALLEQIYRENGFRNELLFGSHAEPARNAAHGRENVGALSWGDPGRNAAFKAAMRAEGVMDANGKMQPGQATLDAQARFIKQEMSTYPNTRAKFLDNPNVDINTSRVVLGDDYIGWRRTDPAYAGHTAKMATFQNNLNSIRAGGNPFPTPTQGSMANVPTQSYGRVSLADMKVQPSPLQQAAIATAPTPPMTVTQSMQRSFSAAPVQVVTPQVQAAMVPAAPVQAAPQISVSTALEQAFMTPMPENGQSFDTSLQQRAQQNLTNLTTPAPSVMSGGDAPTSDMIFAQPDQSTLNAAEVPINAAEPSEAAVAPTVQQINPAQNASVRPLEARTGVSSTRPLPTPRTNSGKTLEAYNPDYYLSNESLLQDQNYQRVRSSLASEMKVATSVIDAVAKGLGQLQEIRKKKK